jgi:TRAP-type C4-dicarboxylate transport system permease small subunit
MHFLKAIEKGIGFLVKIQVLVASFFLIFMTLVIVHGVFMRYVLRNPQAYSVEFARFSLMPLMALALAYTQRVKGHVRVEILLRHLSVRLQRLCEILSHLIFLVYAVFILWAAGRLMVEFYVEGRISEDFGFTLWIVPAFMTLGMIGICLQLFIDLIRSSLIGAQDSETENKTVSDPSSKKVID